MLTIRWPSVEQAARLPDAAALQVAPALVETYEVPDAPAMMTDPSAYMAIDVQLADGEVEGFHTVLELVARKMALGAAPAASLPASAEHATTIQFEPGKPFDVHVPPSLSQTEAINSKSAADVQRAFVCDEEARSRFAILSEYSFSKLAARFGAWKRT